MERVSSLRSFDFFCNLKKYCYDNFILKLYSMKLLLYMYYVFFDLGMISWEIICDNIFFKIKLFFYLIIKKWLLRGIRIL